MAKPFCFTYSKLKSYETCGLQYQHQEILKTPGTEPTGDFIDYGNLVHKTLESAIKHGIGQGGTPLPPRMSHLKYWVDWCCNLPGEKFVEQKWALNRDRMETDYFGTPWYRLKVDFANVDGPLGYLVDWKTGKRLDEPLQLWLGAACMFAHFPDLHTVHSKFVWLKEWGPASDDDITDELIEHCTSTEVVRKDDVAEIWDTLLERIGTLENAVANNVFHPKPGPYCRWCRVPKCDFRGQSQ